MLSQKRLMLASAAFPPNSPYATKPIILQIPDQKPDYLFAHHMACATKIYWQLI